jgi:multiphosphoryl transfer protein
VLTLAARSFDQDLGPDADDAVDAVGGDRPGAGRAGGRPVPASPGIGVGPAFSTLQRPVAVDDARTDEPTREWRRLQQALATVRQEVQQTRARTAREAGQPAAAVFDAHLLLLEDPDLLGDAGARVRGGQAAAPAWSAAVAGTAEQLESLPDPYLRARAADVRALGDRVLAVMLGGTAAPGTKRGVLVAADLTPAQAAELDAGAVQAVVLAAGSVMAHSAILLRARGIPAVVGAGSGVLEIPDGTLLAVDGSAGEVVVDPPSQVLSQFRGRAHELGRRLSEARARASSPARTRDGIQITVGANVGSVAEARDAVANGADLAGLVRTEFLFLGRDRAPDVAEQEAAYRAVADAFAGRRITLRTLDAGGDKPLPYLTARAESNPVSNPVLGLRGIRLSLAQPTLLVDQLRAIVRVARDGPVSVMFPMVSTLGELLRSRQLLDDAISAEGRAPPSDLRVGIMLEVPAAAVTADLFAPHVDFLSIGTNDLTQYALAAERGNDAVAAIGDAYDPGVLRLVQAVTRGVRAQKPVAVCGELAADEHAAGLLVGLGVRELSVAPQAVPRIKQAVRGVRSGDARKLAEAAVSAESASAVRALLAAPRGRPRGSSPGST